MPTPDPVAPTSLIVALTSPYSLTALLVCAGLAIAVSRLLAAPASPRPPRRRHVRDDVLRPRPHVFSFALASGGRAEVDLASGSVALPPPHFPRSSSLPVRTAAAAAAAADGEDGAVEKDDADALQQQPLLSRHRTMPADDVRLADRGLHMSAGRAVDLDAPGAPGAPLEFASRRAADAFTDTLTHARSQRPPESIRLFMTTFNMGNSRPPEDLTPWFGHAADADVIAIGAQECSYSPPDSSDSDNDRDADTRNSTATSEATSETAPDDQKQQQQQQRDYASDKEHWHAVLDAHFPSDRYARLVAHSAWSRTLSVYVRRSLLPFVTRVRVDTANVGVAGVAGNKGAIAVRFALYKTAFLVVNAHLAAHHREVARRNDDYAAIAAGLHALRDRPEQDVLADAVHHVVWLGDLNYRLDLTRDDALRLAKERDWPALRRADQLRAEMAAGRAFDGFQEGDTDFAPTYRYERGSRVYSDYKLRIPSYCDRVLFRALPGCELRLEEYDACDDIMSSDHSPVWATLTAGLHAVPDRASLDAMVDNGERSRKSATDAEGDEPIALDREVKVDESGTPQARSVPAAGIPAEDNADSDALRLVFTALQARDIPAMDYPGRRMAVAKALHIDSALAWKKHVDLGDGQQADPYCTFHGASVAELDDGEFRTTTAPTSQNPLWGRGDIPEVALVVARRSLLGGRHVVVTVRDENVSRADRLIGSAVVPLAPEGEGAGEGADGAPVRFSRPIMRGGRRRGELSGEFVVR